MMKRVENCGVIILAAGQSKRLGTPKQLLPIEGKTLLNRLIDSVFQAGSFPVTVVLGAHAESITATLGDVPVQVVMNQLWEEGMASSIRLGLQTAVQNNPPMDGVLLLVCDQPFVDAETIQQLLRLQHESGLPIAACSYANILGTPAVFHQSMFPHLLTLEGDRGAKKIMKEKESEVAKLHFQEGTIDIDTQEDYQRLVDRIK